MSLETVAVAIASAATALLAAWVAWRKAASEQAAQLKQKTNENRDLEKQLHLREREFLEERNRLELANAETLRAAKAAASEEGRKLGQAERQRDHVTELTNLRYELTARLDKEREQAAIEAREKLRAEYELQTKLFTVKISPYVLIAEDKGLFKDKYETVTGYQYQLLINGIPAFSPHVVRERTEIKTAINEELETMLLKAAHQAAEAAIQVYLGGNPQFAKLSPVIVERATK